MTAPEQCPRCRRFAASGHVCGPKLSRCANPRCRRLLAAWPKPAEGQQCMRCQVREQLAAAIGQGAAPVVNTGRPARRRDS